MNKLIIIVVVLLSLAGFSQCDNHAQKKENMKTTAQKEIIVDVRTVEEWNEDGHASCSVNYPLDQFDTKIEELKKYDRVILVCRSGNRAGIAKMKLMNAGYTKEIENRGPWQNVNCKVN